MACVTGTPAGTVNWEVLQRRLTRLEEENKSLRVEANHLAEQTEECEQQEARLVAELAAQLASARTDLSGVSIDANRTREESEATQALADALAEKLQCAEVKISAVGFSSNLCTAVFQQKHFICRFLLKLV